MLGSGPELLGKPDIDNLAVLIINYAKGRQLVSDDNPDNMKRKCQNERAVQTKGGMPQSCTNKKQDAETKKKQHNADNTVKPRVITNLMVIGNNNNENSFLSESTKILIVSFQR